MQLSAQGITKKSNTDVSSLSYIMDAQQQRGRSPSAGPNRIRHTPSPSPHNAFRVSSVGADPGISSTQSSFNTFESNHTSPGESPFTLTSHYNSPDQQQQFFQQQPQTISNQSFLQPSALEQQAGPNAPFGQAGDFTQNPFGINSSAAGNPQYEPAYFPDTGLGQEQPNYMIDSREIDPQLFDSSPPQNTSVDPSHVMSGMATAHNPTPPHLLHTPEMHRMASGGSPGASPALSQGGFGHSPSHSRHASLDPSSAAYSQNNQEWGMQFSRHKRVPSDARSDISSSAHPSPYMSNLDSFDQPSPLLNAQPHDQALMQDLNMQQFTISDNQPFPSHISPAHSPQPSPRLMAQQALPPFNGGDNFGLQASMGNFGLPQPPFGQEPFPTLQNGPNDMNPNTMSPPGITIELAPPSRINSFEPSKPDAHMEADALSPPCKKFLCYLKLP